MPNDDDDIILYSQDKMNNYQVEINSRGGGLGKLNCLLTKETIGEM